MLKVINTNNKAILGLVKLNSIFSKSLMKRFMTIVCVKYKLYVNIPSTLKIFVEPILNFWFSNTIKIIIEQKVKPSILGSINSLKLKWIFGKTSTIPEAINNTLIFIGSEILY